MPRHLLNISYLGAPFHGWQRQPGDSSVQQTLEEALTTLLRSPIAVTGAGRTDTGVNARIMPAHFTTDSPIADRARLVKSLNAILPRSIVVNSIQGVADDFHARFDATSRTYRYYAVTAPTPFLTALAWKAPAKLDFDAMNAAARLLPGTADFASFAKLHSDVKTTVCTVTDARWTATGPHTWYFEITADRFLRNMVRAVVGTLVDVGRGKITPSGFADIIAQRNRCAAGTSMPPHPLYLWNVTYPGIMLDEPPFMP